MQVQSLHLKKLKLVSLHSEWQNKPTCLEAGLVNQTLKEYVWSLINLKNHGKQLIAPWPHTADMDLPTSLPTIWLKVVDHPVPGMLCTLCKKYKKVPCIFKMIFLAKQMGGVNGCGLLWALHKIPVGNAACTYNYKEVEICSLYMY